MNKKFEDFNLDKYIIKALYNLNYTKLLLYIYLNWSLQIFYSSITILVFLLKFNILVFIYITKISIFY